MDNKEFMAYIKDMKRQGLDNRQIATKLGMDILAFETKCQEVFDEENQRAMDEVYADIMKEKLKTPAEKPVSGAAEPKKHEGVNYLNTEIIDERYL